MPKARDYSMLKIDTMAFRIALADAELELQDLAKKAGVSNNIIYTAHKGCYVKPLYVGKISKALGVSVKDIVCTERRTSGDKQN